jgi:hypothetical protein
MYNVDLNNCQARMIGLNTDLCTSLLNARSALAPPAGALTRTDDQTDELWEQGDNAALNASFFALGFASPLRAWLADATRASYQVCVLDLANAAANTTMLAPTPAPSAAQLASDTAINLNTRSFALVETRVSSVAMLCTTSRAAARSSAGWVAFNGAFYLPTDPSAVAAAFASPGGFAIVPVRTTSSTETLYDVVTYSVTQLTTSQWGMLAGVAPTMIQFLFGTATIESGNYTGYGNLLSSVIEAFSTCPASYPIGVGSTTQSGVGKQGIMRYESQRNYRFMISTVDSTAASVQAVWI